MCAESIVRNMKEGREEKMEKVTVRVTRLQWVFSKKKVGFKSLPETMYRVHFTERQKDISRSRTSEREWATGEPLQSDKSVKTEFTSLDQTIQYLFQYVFCPFVAFCPTLCLHTWLDILSLPYLFVTFCNRTAGQSWEVEIHPEREKYTFDVTQDNAVVSLQCSLGNTSSPSLEWYDGQGKIISDIYSGWVFFIQRRFPPVLCVCVWVCAY